MKNRELNVNYPTPAELYALERSARVARSAELARLLRNAVFGVKAWYSASKTNDKGLRHA